MEKIYMENNNNNKKNSIFQQVFKSQLSKKLSVAMVLVSFFSFLMMGVGNVSYAAPAEIPEGGLGNSFTTGPVGSQINGYGGTEAFPVFMYSTTTGIPIFCLQRDVPFLANTTLTKTEAIEDQGLLYTMANTYPHVTLKDQNGEEFPIEVQTWIAQATIWEYLYESGEDYNQSTSGGTSQNVGNIQKVYQLNFDTKDAAEPWCDVTGCYASSAEANSKVTFYEKYIKDVVANAMKTDVSVNGSMTMSIANQEISITDDEKYYQTAMVTVGSNNPSSLVSSSVSVDIVSAPDGTILVDENGQEIEDTSGITKFYVRIPVKSVTEDNKVVELSASGTFRTYQGDYYTATGAQTVSTVYTTDEPRSTGLEIPINYTPSVPDTGMNLAQSIYFIGLLVLLCGVGIIYANTKPKEKQQQ